MNQGGKCDKMKTFRKRGLKGEMREMHGFFDHERIEGANCSRFSLGGKASAAIFVTESGGNILSFWEASVIGEFQIIRTTDR